MKNISKLRALKLVLLLSLLLTKGFSQTTNHQVYSLFVMNIAKYSAWPSLSGEFRITVIGKSKVYEELVKTIGSKMINGLPVRVTQTENITDIDNQEVVYLSDGKSSLLDDLLKSIAHKSIMVITEREGLFKKGAGFSFILTDNNTLRFDINNTELEKRQIKVSKSLTSLANTIL